MDDDLFFLLGLGLEFFPGRGLNTGIGGGVCGHGHGCKIRQSVSLLRTLNGISFTFKGFGDRRSPMRIE